MVRISLLFKQLCEIMSSDCYRVILSAAYSVPTTFVNVFANMTRQCEPRRWYVKLSIRASGAEP